MIVPCLVDMCLLAGVVDVDVKACSSYLIVKDREDGQRLDWKVEHLKSERLGLSLMCGTAALCRELVHVLFRGRRIMRRSWGQCFKAAR